MLSFNEVNVYILENHCTSPAEVRLTSLVLQLSCLQGSAALLVCVSLCVRGRAINSLADVAEVTHLSVSSHQVRPLRNLMSLGEDTADSPMCSEVANQMEGLTNTTVALLACTAEETGAFEFVASY